MKGFNARAGVHILLHTLLLIIFSSLLTTVSTASQFKIILLTSNKGILQSEKNGAIWKDLNQGLPPEFIPERIDADPEKNLYLVTRRSGIFRLGKNAVSWEDLNSDLFRRVSSLKKNNEYRKISALSVDSGMSSKIAIATKHSIFIKSGSVKPWKRYNRKISENYITALSQGGKSGEIFAGTSYDGLIKYNAGAATWISSNLPKEPYSKKRYFYEEISHIAVDGNNPAVIYAGLNFGGGVYKSHDGGKNWVDLRHPGKPGSLYEVCDLKFYRDRVYVSTADGIYSLDREKSEWKSLDITFIKSSLQANNNYLSFLLIDKSGIYPPLFIKLKDPMVKKRKDFKGAADNKKAIYISIPSIRKRLDTYIKFINESNLNAVVIDMKDDFGHLCYESNLKVGKEIGAVKRPVNIKGILDKLKQNNIYSVARIVVFKDEKLYNAYNKKYAILDKEKMVPWRGNPREFWVDPYSEFVRNYNIEIAEELEKMGFDEIQFDYIRFPSDGPIDKCYYRFKKDSNGYKSEILSDFLIEAKERLNVPVSVDIYGYNAWYRFGSIIGQDAEEFSEIIDVVCPMVYPSHFGKRFYMNGPRHKRSYRVVHDGGKRTGKIIGHNALIRPYLQAFKLMSPTWGTEYINNQIQGAEDSGCHGYTFWNAGGRYKILKEALTAVSKKK